MNEIDARLKRALRRCQPPEGFADRVLARVSRESALARTRPLWPLWRSPSLFLRWAAVGALVAALVTGIEYQISESRERAEALAAKQQVMVALRITASKLRVAKQRVKSVEAGTQKLENTL